ncbi:MAG: CbtB-domain containing protein [Nitrosopumilus sp.]|uniref:CbtB domain-containing protein n=1 Tax=Nitrosopumilus sp. TaxID=2024843 RepID=UPI00247BC06E|nr:CbtB domain-containing protein [Nitrosopumilus sp.]MCV0392290.1 CbtB-domain containing protein [Nitrosopumilus sp.]
MSEARQINVSTSNVSKLAIVALAIIFAAGLFVVGFDQGHIFSIVYGEQAFADLYIHELTHDMRHAAGFPCH